MPRARRPAGPPFLGEKSHTGYISAINRIGDNTGVRRALALGLCRAALGAGPCCHAGAAFAPSSPPASHSPSLLPLPAALPAQVGVIYFIGAGLWTLESLWSLWVYK